MNDRLHLERTLFSILATCAVAAACTGSSKGGTTNQSACDDSFDVLLGIACNESSLPASEVSRIRARFDAICLRQLALPGNGETAASLEGCTSAIKATGCGSANAALPECAFEGSLADGAPCNESSQCKSGICQLSLGTAGDSGATTPTCGACAPGIPLGQPCATGDTCVDGALCAVSGTGFACTRIAYGGVGAACDDLAAECKTGLYCDKIAQQCTSPAAEGAACTETLGCAPPLTCAAGEGGASAECRPPGAAGASCQQDADCAPGLACSLASAQCKAIQWVSQGQACGDVAICLVGICPPTGTGGGPGTTGGTCPIVISDGQPCAAGDFGHTCDAFASCTNGVCQTPDSQACH